MADALHAAPSLVSIRRDLEEIDRAIVLLVAARVEAACTAIRLRSEGNGEVSDPAQEERVLARAQGWAEQAGLSPARVRTIFRAVVGAGKDRFATESRPLRRPVLSTRVRSTGRSRGRVPSRRDPKALPHSRTPTPK
ncbi:MAG TPA: chorismate mutase [Thermoplasmata archaeon]|jgi:chorismate mutase